MKRISCTFYRPEHVNIDEYENIVGKLELDLQKICSETIDPLSIYYYVYKLLRTAEPLENDADKYFLGLGNPRTMPSDARVDFFYKPTYLATAIIIKACMICPELIDEKEDCVWEHADECMKKIREVLPRMMSSCTGRGFSGHGYSGLEGLIETLGIFKYADVEGFLEKHPELCEDFSALYRSTLEMISEKVATETLTNSWGEDYTDAARELLQ